MKTKAPKTTKKAKTTRQAKNARKQQVILAQAHVELVAMLANLRMLEQQAENKLMHHQYRRPIADTAPFLDRLGNTKEDIEQSIRIARSQYLAINVEVAKVRNLISHLTLSPEHFWETEQKLISQLVKEYVLG